MKVATTLAEFAALRTQLAGPVGFVPTMGYLHEGHLSLSRLARSSCESVVASIFVNPAQFAPSEDLSSYPRDLKRDLALLEAEGVNLVLAPASNDEFYPEGYDTWGRRGRDHATIGGCLQACALPRGGNHCGQTVQHRSTTTRILRAKGCAASHRHPSDDSRSQLRCRAGSRSHDP